MTRAMRSRVQSRKNSADALLMRLLSADFHIERRRRGEPEGLRVLGDGANQEPAALLELNAAERAGLRHVLEEDSPLDLAISDDFNKANRVLCGQFRREIEVDLLARGGVEYVTGKPAVGGDAQERSIRYKRATVKEALPPTGVSRLCVEMNIDAIVADRIG